MAVKIYKLEDGAVRTTHVEPHDLHNHLENGWVLEAPKPKEKGDLEKPDEPEVKREKLTLNQSHKPR